MKFYPYLAAATALMGGCTTASEMPRAEQIYITDKMSAQITAGLRQALKDPDSARYGPTAAGRHGGSILVCGYVNAKNSFGGYTGMSPYYGYLNPSTGVFRVIRFGDDAGSEYAVKKYCTDTQLWKKL